MEMLSSPTVVAIGWSMILSPGEARTKIRDRIDAHLKAGATHVCILPIRSDNESLPDLKAVEAFAPR